MQIEGTGFTTFSAKIQRDFKPDTVLALNWSQLSSGFYSCTDRTYLADQYAAKDVHLYAKENIINSFIDAIDANRTTGNNVVTLSQFNEGEHIFGEDVDHSGSITATIFVDLRNQKTWKGWSLPLRIAAMSPSFVGTPALPLLRLLEIGVSADAERTINKFDSYARIFKYQDSNSDFGLFEGTFTFSPSEMQSIRRYIATQRGSTIFVPGIYGISKPFGRRSSSESFYASIIDWEDLGYYGADRRLMRIVFAEAKQALA